MINTCRRTARSALMAGTILAMMPYPAFAADSMTADELLIMIEAQQRQLDALKASLEEAEKQVNDASNEAKAAAEMSQEANPLKAISIGGVIEVEATRAETFAGVESSDITLATIEVFLDTAPTDYVSTHIQFLYEDDGNDNIILDEAFATWGNTDKYPLYGQAGKWVVPFGNFGTEMSTDPLTLNLGETKEATILAGVAWDSVVLEGYIYNGDSQQTGDDDNIDQGGLSLGYGGEFDGGTFDLGMGYISNIADSDEVTTGLGNNATALDDYVGGADVNATVAFGDAVFRAEYMTALSSFKAGELAFNGQGAEPEAWHLEASYATSVSEKDLVIAATVQGTEESLALGLPETRIGGAITISVLENASVTAEYLYDEDYGTSDGGTGNDAHTATIKLATEF